MTQNNQCTSQKTRKPKRAISGVFLLDKAQGITSNKALQQVRFSYQAEKAGHTGALDPMATGLLPICLGEATKFSHYLLDADKSYQAKIQLGLQTDSGDADGNIIAEQNIPTLSEDIINHVLSEFMGSQQQIPPMYSALKKDGKKLYELAREGKTVERTARNIVISELSLVGFTQDSLTISVTCSKGTYIRVLGEDIAKRLGTVGHLTMLRRTGTGMFDLNDAMTFTELEQIATLIEKDDLLLPCYASIEHFSKLTLNEQQAERVRLGQRLNLYEQAKELFNQKINVPDEEQVGYKIQVVLLFCNDVFLGLGELAETGRLQPKRIVNL